MGKDYGRQAAGRLADELYERMLGVGHNLIARDDMPQTAEEFANVVVHAVFDALAGGVQMVNKETGWHGDDPRWDQPEADVSPSVGS
jgi:hypothetical protein